ncbi:hypothetical protein IFM89_002379 [Coptis chinensis]|uniref:Cytochrome P450 n=1 Tax=Coptis chinensis TaxID=261450 RepID=A0A835M9F1_9MAGN|nr:hypothetical protein IFM89_002379 [Coptis chinensis]
MESLSNSFTTLSTAIAALIVLITVTFVVRKLSDKKRYCPVAGTVFHLIFNFHRAHDYMTDLARKNKTFRILSPFRSEVFTSDPATVEYILKANFSNYGKGGHFHAVMEDMMGDGIINVDGERWLYQRKIFSHEFSTKNLKDFSSAVFQRNAEELAGTVLKVANLNKSVDIQELFLKTTLDTIFEVGFGVELDSIYGIEEGARFAKAFNDISASVLWRYVDMTWKIRKFFNIGSEASLKSNLKVIDDFLFKLIRTKLEKLSNPNHDSSIRKEDLLSRFLDLNDKDPKYLRDIVSNFLHAGRDTAAATLSWFMYRMCIHPHMQEKIAQEVKDAAQLKDTATIREYVAVVSEGHVLDKMQYLHSALSESLRLHPPVPVAGPRICPGKEFGYAEMKIFISVLLRFFPFELEDENKPVDYITMLNLHIDGPLKLRAFPRVAPT